MRVWRFYSGEGTDHRGRSLNEILAWDDDALEDEHDFIQWLFPLTEPSGVNPHAPLLSPDEMRQFHQSAEVQARVLDAFRRMLGFYGLQMREAGSEIQISKAENYPRRSRNWITPSNHNFLRVTRILKSLRLLGLRRPADAFFVCLEQIFRENRAVIGARTFEFWERAIHDEPR
jgi:hypothetical protein